MSKIKVLIPVIIQKTIEDKIVWDAASAAEFYTEVGDRTLSVVRRGNTNTITNGPYSYSVRLSDSSGNVIESYRENGKNIGLSAELFDLSRRKALKIDENLDAFERELRSL